MTSPSLSACWRTSLNLWRFRKKSLVDRCTCLHFSEDLSGPQIHHQIDLKALGLPVVEQSWLKPLMHTAL